MTTKRYKSKQSTNDYATSNFTTTVTVLEIHNNMWNSFFGCFCVPNSLSNEETPLNFPWLRVLWRNKLKLYRKPTDQPRVRTDWIASLPMAFALVLNRVTVHNLSFDWCAWLSWRKILFRSTKKWVRQCGIRNHAPFSMIQSSTLALTPMPDSSNHLFFPVFIFALFFCFFTRGQSELCDELQQRRPVKCQRVVASMEVDKENEFPPLYCKNYRQEKQPLSITDARAVTFHLKVSPSFLH